MDRRTFVSRLLLGIPVLPAAALAASQPEVDWMYESGNVICPLCHCMMLCIHRDEEPRRMLVEHLHHGCDSYPECVNAGKKWELEKRPLKRVLSETRTLENDL